MKKVCVNMIALCLATTGCPSDGLPSMGWLDAYLTYPEQETERIREDFKDAAKLRECFSKKLLLTDSVTDTKIEGFKRKFGISDERMQSVLMDIIRESSAKIGWERYGMGDAMDMRAADMRLAWGFTWLGFCAEEEGKRFLMGVAADKAKDNEFRVRALASYLCRADEKETLDAVTRFLTGDMKGTVSPHYSGIYRAAIRAYDKAADTPQTRGRIESVLSAALAEEDNKRAFMEIDSLLAERSAEWADSPQRKAALERMVSQSSSWLAHCLELPENAAVRYREELKDKAMLRKCIMSLVCNPDSARMPPGAVEAFKQKYGVSNEAMQAELLEIVREAGAKNGWKKREGPDDPLDMVADLQTYWGLAWLYCCAEEEGKSFLMGIATDQTKDIEFRKRAIGSYLGRADEKETLDAVTRFLAGDMKGTVSPYYSGIYRAAIRAYDKAAGDPQTRGRIASVLSAALAEEGNNFAFTEIDSLLAERSAEWAGSPQRKAALERFGKPHAPEAP